MSWQPPADENDEDKKEPEGQEQAFKRIQRERDEARKEADRVKAEAEALRAEARAIKVQTAITQAGGKESWASFVPADVEATPDAIREFLVKAELLSAEAKPETPATPAAPSFSPTIQGTPPVPNKITMAAWEQLHRSSPEEALRKLERGEVDLPRSPYEIYAEPFVQRGG